MITEEQRRLRKSGLGGNDAAAAAGLSRWNTRLELWTEKTDPDASTEETYDMRWRGLMEPVVRQPYCNTTGRTVIEPQETLRHPEYSFLLPNLDGIRATIRQFSTTNLIGSNNMVVPGDLVSFLEKFRKAGTIYMPAITEANGSSAPARSTAEPAAPANSAGAATFPAARTFTIRDKPGNSMDGMASNKKSSNNMPGIANAPSAAICRNAESAQQIGAVGWLHELRPGPPWAKWRVSLGRLKKETAK